MMLGALSILAYAASMMTHEALGHGGYCLAMGGHNSMLTAWREGCSAHPPGIEAAGPGVQFGVGLLAWLALKRLPRGNVRVRYFFWLCMVFGLLISSSYVAFGGVTDFGDAAVVIAGLSAHIVWRGVLILLGAVVYFFSMRVTALELRRLAGLDDGRRRLFRLVWIPYITASAFACCSGALNRTMGHGAAIGLAAASSFGAGLGMLWLPDLPSEKGLDILSPTVYLEWSAAWGAAAALVVVAFLFFIGPGLK
jgi:hypothetical protein